MSSELDELEELEELDKLDQQFSQPVSDAAAPKRKKGLLFKATMALVTGAVLIVFAGGLWFTYNHGVRIGSEAAAPLLVADKPAKIQPTDPGGLHIPHQDKRIYNQISGETRADDLKVERILPAAEKPVIPPKDETVAKNEGEEKVKEESGTKPANKITKSIVTSVLSGNRDSPLLKNKTAGKKEEKEANGLFPLQPYQPPKDQAGKADALFASSAEESKPSTPAPSTPTSSGIVKVEATAAKKKTAPASSSTLSAPAAEKKKGHWRIQIAAVRSQERAQIEWNKHKDNNKDLMEKLNLEVQKISVGNATYFRVRGGPVKSLNEARRLCEELKKRKVSCIVVRPEL